MVGVVGEKMLDSWDHKRAVGPSDDDSTCHDLARCAGFSLSAGIVKMESTRTMRRGEVGSGALDQIH